MEMYRLSSWNGGGSSGCGGGCCSGRNASSPSSRTALIGLLSAFAATSSASSSGRLVGRRDFHFETIHFFFGQDNLLDGQRLHLFRRENRMFQKVRGRFVEGVRVVSEESLDFLVAEWLPLDPDGSEPGPAEWSGRLVPFQYFPGRHSLLLVEPVPLFLVVAVESADFVALRVRHRPVRLASDEFAGQFG